MSKAIATIAVSLAAAAFVSAGHPILGFGAIVIGVMWIWGD